MSKKENLEVEAEVRILDREENSRSDVSCDEYLIVVRDGSVAEIKQFWTEDPSSSVIPHQFERIKLSDIPENVVSQEANIKITSIEGEKEVHYRFMHSSGGHDAVLRDGEPIEKSQVPLGVLDEAEQSFPTEIDCDLAV